MKKQINKSINKKHWPVPNSFSKKIPEKDAPGSFWKDRGDRHHCGIDIYAPRNSEVISIEDGIVFDIGVFTSPEEISYWNTTYYIIINNKSGFICKYAELGYVVVNVNSKVKAGQVIGYIGVVLNSKKIDSNVPIYIQKINQNEKHSMLHFELYDSLLNCKEKYSGGNWFGNVKPNNLLNPYDYLKSTF